MKSFNHIEACTVEEAVDALKISDKAYPIAGGTDLLGCLKDEVWLEYPDLIVDLKKIRDLDKISYENDQVKIGAMATLTDILESKIIKEKCPALAEAARRTASPLLRNMGTIAGNICQENRCWYYRYPSKLGGGIPCVRKGGKVCLAIPGDSRYHSIFGAVNKCIAVNPSDTAPALVALDANIITNKREISITNFFSAEHGKQSTILDHGEIVLKIIIPSHSLRNNSQDKNTISKFKKIALRKSIDFAIVNCAVCIQTNDGKVYQARLCLNGVHNNPLRASEAEEFLIGKELTEEIAEKAAIIALKKAKPLRSNKYKVNLAKSILKDCILSRVCCSHP